MNLHLEAQDYKKNNGTATYKEDPNKEYQTAGIDSVDLLKALDLAGVRIFKIPLRSFDKKYKLLLRPIMKAEITSISPMAPAGPFINQKKSEKFIIK